MRKGIVYKGKTKKGRDLIIRYPRMSDVRGLLEYINLTSAERTFLGVQGEQVTLQEEYNFVKELIKKIKDHKAVALTAFCDGVCAGASKIEIERFGAAKHVGGTGIGLRKEFRGDGIGSILIKSILSEAKKHLRGLKIVRLDVFAENIVAIKLYKKAGFKQFGILPNGLKRRGKFSDRIFMYREV